MIEQLPITLIDANPFNSRVLYKESEIRKLAKSLAEHGLLEPVRVRKSGSRYQLVFGHNRLRAATLLNWKTIEAEVSSCSDEKMLELSCIENDSRHALSDYEKGLAFSRMNKEFNKTYEEIGRSIGYSKSHVCNLVRMTELFDPIILAQKSVACDLHRISEHHARILAQIRDQKSRLDAFQVTIANNLSVRELQHVIQRLRSWFGNENQNAEESQEEKVSYNYLSDKRGEDKVVIRNLLEKEIVLPLRGDFNSFAEMHAYQSGFCSFNDIPPLHRLEGDEALRNDKEWFYSMAPHYSARIFDLRIQVVDSMALTTFYISYTDKKNDKECVITRATVVCVKIAGKWMILHEHGSRLDTRSGQKFARENRLSKRNAQSAERVRIPA